MKDDDRNLLINKTDCYIKVLRGSKYYKIEQTTTNRGTIYGSPFSILVIGYKTLYILNSVTSSSILDSCIQIIDEDVSATANLSEGKVRFSTDPNRQYLAIHPACVNIIEA